MSLIGCVRRHAGAGPASGSQDVPACPGPEMIGHALSVRGGGPLCMNDLLRIHELMRSRVTHGASRELQQSVEKSRQWPHGNTAPPQ